VDTATPDGYDVFERHVNGTDDLWHAYRMPDRTYHVMAPTLREAMDTLDREKRNII
jgi:hypothetical protein